MKELTTSMVYKSKPQGIPEDLIIWQDENHGLEALVGASKDIAQGKIVSFALCEHKPHKTPVMKQIIYIGLGANKSPRICGEENNPDGAGSYSLVPTWYDYCADPHYIAAGLALFLSCSVYFRLENLK